MNNNYAASEMVEIGRAQDIIHGMKPICVDIDSILGTLFWFWVFEDIDEGEE